MDFLKHDVNNIPFTRAGPCSPGKDVVYEVDTPDPNPAYPGPLMSSKIQTVDLIRYILWRAQECLRYIHEGDQVEAYFFWQIMELFCRRNGKVMMCEVATTIFKAYSLLRKKMPELRMNQKDWCVDLAQLLCSYVPYDEHREGVMKMGDDLASRGMTYSAHVCYVVAKMQLGLRSWFQLIGCDSRMPFGVTVMEEAFVRTEMYEYVLSLSSGLVQPSFQVFKLCYASRLALYSCSDARKYCETIAMAAMTFPEHFKRNFLERLLWLSYKLHEEEGEEPEWQTKLWDLHNNLKFAGANLERQDLEGCATTGEIPAVLTPDEEQHTDPMDVLESRYTVGEMLGKGYFGCVCTGVRNKDGRRVAIKFVDKLNQLGKENFSSLTIPGETRQLPVEVAVMKMVSKPPRCSNVVELLDWFAMPDAIALVMEQPSPCVDLKEFIRRHNGRLSEAQARDVMWQVVQAARHCLVRGVMHCDITAENLLINIDTLQVKLIDFGSSGLLQDTPYRQFCGSNVLVPPEFLYYGVYMGVPATIWGLGIVLYNLLSGEYPFKSDEDFDSGHLNLCPDMSPECFDLMLWCLQLNPDTRPTFENILGHEWFTEGVQDKVRDFAAGPLDVPIDAAGKVKEHWTVDHAALPSYLSQKSCVGVHVLGGVRPEVSVFHKNSSPEVVCHATGFFPKSVNITWQKDGEDVHEDVELRETLLNQDGSFQKRSILKVPAEELQKHNYTCVIQHSSSEEQIVREVPKGGVPDKISGGAPITIIVAVVVPFIALVVFGVVIWRKRKNSASEGDSSSNNS